MTAENPTGEQYRDADSHTNTRINGPTHTRIKAHNRESETLSATIDRALDALERERDLPDAVAAALRDADSDTDEERKPCGEYHPLPCGVDEACPETGGSADE